MNYSLWYFEAGQHTPYVSLGFLCAGGIVLVKPVINRTRRKPYTSTKNKSYLPFLKEKPVCRNLNHLKQTEHRKTWVCWWNYQEIHMMQCQHSMEKNRKHTLCFFFSLNCSSLLLLRCLIIRNAAYYDTRSISQLLQSIRNLYWIIDSLDIDTFLLSQQYRNNKRLL